MVSPTPSSPCSAIIPTSSSINAKFQVKDSVFARDGGGIYEAIVKKIAGKTSTTSDASVEWVYLLHFKGWSKRHDKWIPERLLMEPTKKARRLARNFQTNKLLRKDKVEKTNLLQNKQVKNVKENIKTEDSPKWQMFMKQESFSENLEEMGWKIIPCPRPKGSCVIDRIYVSPKNSKKFRSRRQATIFMSIVKYFNGSEDKAYSYFKQNEPFFKRNRTEMKQIGREGEKQIIEAPLRSRTKRYHVNTNNKSKMEKARKGKEIKVGTSSSSKKLRKTSDTEIKHVGSRNIRTKTKQFDRNGEDQMEKSTRSRTTRHQMTNDSKVDKTRKRNEIEVGASSNKKQRRTSDRVLSQVKQVGSRVYARYTNKQWYWGKIIRISEKNGAPRYEVKFDDEDVLDDIKDEHLVLEHEYCAKQESVFPPSSWHKLVETEPLDEKLEEWGWTKKSSDQRKASQKNDGYWYLSPKTQKKFRSKKKAKLFGLIVEYFNGSEEDAYKYVIKNDTFFNSFVWGKPLKKEKKVKSPIQHPAHEVTTNLDQQVEEVCMESTDDNEVSEIQHPAHEVTTNLDQQVEEVCMDSTDDNEVSEIQHPAHEVTANLDQQVEEVCMDSTDDNEVSEIQHPAHEVMTNLDQQVEEVCMDFSDDNEVSDNPKIENPTEAYLISLQWTEWTESRPQREDEKRKCWSPPVSSKIFYDVAHAVKYLDFLRETDGNEEAAFNMSKNEANSKPKMGSPTERYLLALRWDQIRRQEENGPIKVFWSPRESTKEFYSVVMAVEYLDYLRETDGNEAVAYERSQKKEPSRNPKNGNVSDIYPTSLQRAEI